MASGYAARNKWDNSLLKYLIFIILLFSLGSFLLGTKRRVWVADPTGACADMLYHSITYIRGGMECSLL